MNKKLTILSIIAGLFLAGCETGPKVQTTVTPGSDLGSYKTFSMVILPPQDPSLIALGKIARDAVQEELASKGYNFVEGGNSDIQVAVHGNIVRKTDITDWGYVVPRRGRFGYVGGTVVDIEQYNEGTLTIDIVDTKKGELVWRGWATKDHISGKPDESKIINAVGLILEGFPSR